LNIVAYSLFSSSPREEEMKGKRIRKRMREKERWEKKIGELSKEAKRKA